MKESQQSTPSRNKRTPGQTILRFQDLTDLIVGIYQPNNKKKRVALSKAEIGSIQSRPAPNEETREKLLQLALSDRTLERSRELLFICYEKFGRNSASASLREFVRDVLRHHPAYQLKELHGVLENLPDAASVEVAISALSSQSFSNLVWAEESASLSKREVQALRGAAAHCLLLWVSESRSFPFDKLLRILYENAWLTGQSKSREVSKPMRFVLMSKDTKALDIVFSTLEKAAIEKAREAAAARASEDREKQRAEKIQLALNEAHGQIEAANSRITTLEENARRLELEHANQVTHMRNDFEELRGKVLYRLGQEVVLLGEGLHALRKQPPKVHVMIDHADRAIDGLKSEIDRINRDSK